MPAPRAGLCVALVLAVLGAVLCACQEHGPVAAPALTLRPVSFAGLGGWADDNAAGAIPAFLKSCRAFLAEPDDRPLDPAVSSGDFGTVGEWRGPCTAAEKLPGTDAAAKEFFETGFVPLLAGNRGDSQGRFTGYFEIVLNGSRRQEGPFQTPIYRRPPDPKTSSRAEIEAGALAGKKLELAWLDDAIGAYFLTVQDRARSAWNTGGAIRVGYDGSNGHPYVALGHLLVERGEVPLPQLTMDTLRAWTGMARPAPR